MKGQTMRIRTLATAGLVALGLGAAAQASTIFCSLKATPVVGTPGLFDVGIYAKTDQGESAPGAGDGGVAGFQFDILSAGDNLAQPLPSAPSGPNFNKVKTTFAVPLTSFGFQNNPNKQDGSASNGYPADADNDLDAVSGSFADTGGTFATTNLGRNQSANGGLGDLIATEQWQLNNPVVPEFLNLFIIGPQYYNFANTAGNFRSTYTTSVPTGIVLGVPEPSILGLASVAGLGWIRRRRA